MKSIESFKLTCEDLGKKEEKKKEKEKITEIEKLENNSEKLKKVLMLLETYLFPNNQLPIKLVKEIEGKYENRIPVAAHVFDEDENGKIINAYYEVNEKIDEKDYNLNDLLEIAFHEIRHRVQHNSPVKLFSRKDLEYLSKRYPEIELYLENVPKNLTPNDFDACTVEEISISLWMKEFLFSDILKEVISKDSEEIIKKLKEWKFIN